jgi:ABC-type nitrate/sulfonate/bicarbonate transport system permease component
MAEEAPRPRYKRLSGFLLLGALLLLWQWSALYAVSSTNWPPVTEIMVALVRSIRSGELLQAVFSSLYRMFVGYGAGVIAAVTLGLVMAHVRFVKAALEPLFEFVRPIPIPAIIPPLILILGIDDAMKIFVVAFSVFFPVLINTLAGIRSVEPVALDVARTLQLSRARTIRVVVLPAAMPYIMAGMRVSLALALIVTVVAEMIAGSEGIGYYLTTMQYAMRASEMYASIFVLAATGYVLNRAILAVEHRVLHWFLR